VVIDEAHNVTNTQAMNNELARVLAPNTEALILASATPHNGRNESFAEILRLLDPTAVRPDGTFDPKHVENLIIRRHRHSRVAQEVGADWAEQEEPTTGSCPPPRENAIAESFRRLALPRRQSAPYSGQNGALFSWILPRRSSSPAAFSRRSPSVSGSSTPIPLRGQSKPSNGSATSPRRQHR
jgi:hypothetical protein